jgi:hypothetical protein
VEAWLPIKRATILSRANFTKAMSRTSKKTANADEVADMASRGEDISGYFTNQFTVVRPVRRVNVDPAEGMLRELDHRSTGLNISRQAAIKRAIGSRKRKGGSGDPPQA